jgi:hypothetical protein
MAEIRTGYFEKEIWRVDFEAVVPDIMICHKGTLYFKATTALAADSEADQLITSLGIEKWIGNVRKVEE